MCGQQSIVAAAAAAAAAAINNNNNSSNNTQLSLCHYMQGYHWWSRFSGSCISDMEFASAGDHVVENTANIQILT